MDLDIFMFLVGLSVPAGTTENTTQGMGTSRDTKMDAKRELEAALALLGWSRRRLVEVVYVELHDDDDRNEIARLEERVKKEFQRASTRPERFERYLGILRMHPDYQRLDRVTPMHFPGPILDRDVLSGIARISDAISLGLIADETAAKAIE